MLFGLREKEHCMYLQWTTIGENPRGMSLILRRKATRLWGYKGTP